MEKKKLNALLTGLRQAGIDAVYAYDQVIPKLEDRIMNDRLTVFRNSHARHTEELGKLLRDLQDNRSDLTGAQDLKGLFLEGMAALRGMAGTKSALKALLSVEDMTNQRYGDAVSLQAPEHVHDLLRKHFSDVKIHLDYITSNLEALP